MSLSYDIQYNKICDLFDDLAEVKSDDFTKKHLLNKFVLLNEIFFSHCSDINSKSNSSTNENYIHIIDSIIKIIKNSSEIDTQTYICYLIKYCVLLRDIRGESGKGERLIFYTVFLHLYILLPNIMKGVLKNIPNFGSWLDYNKLYEIISRKLKTEKKTENSIHYLKLKNEIMDIWCNQFKLDTHHMDNNNYSEISLCIKWIPKENKSLDRRFGVTKNIVKKIYKKLWYTSKTKALRKFRDYITYYNRNIYNELIVIKYPMNPLTIQSIIKEIINCGSSQIMKIDAPLKYAFLENTLSIKMKELRSKGPIDAVFIVDNDSGVYEDFLIQNTYNLLIGTHLTENSFHNKVLILQDKPLWVQLKYPESLYDFINSDIFYDIFYSYDMRKVGKELDFLEKIDILLHLPESHSLNLNKITTALNNYNVIHSIKMPEIICCLTDKKRSDIHCIVPLLGENNHYFMNYNFVLWNSNLKIPTKELTVVNCYNIYTVIGFDRDLISIFNSSCSNLNWNLIKTKVESPAYLFVDNIVNIHINDITDIFKKKLQCITNKYIPDNVTCVSKSYTHEWWNWDTDWYNNLNSSDNGNVGSCATFNSPHKGNWGEDWYNKLNTDDAEGNWGEDWYNKLTKDDDGIWDDDWYNKLNYEDNGNWNEYWYNKINIINNEDCIGDWDWCNYNKNISLPNIELLNTWSYPSFH